MGGSSEILFGGILETPSQDVFDAARARWPLWVERFYAGYKEFAARPENVDVWPQPGEKGATVEQVGLFQTYVFGTECYCVLARPMEDSNHARLHRVVRCSPLEAVDTLKEIQSKSGHITASTLHYDGHTGHTVLIREYDEGRDRFVYHDPWPAKSLLCRENNIADVDARPEGRYWSVTAKELQRVIFASFVLPQYWARLQDVDFDLMLDSWEESEFFHFFRLHLVDESIDGEGLHRMYAPGAFARAISLTVSSNATGKIGESRLRLRREWLQENLPLALDLCKSFVMAFAPGPDQETYRAVSDALWSLRHGQVGQLEVHDAMLAEVVLAFIEQREHVWVRTDLGSLALANVVEMEERILELTFDLH